MRARGSSGSADMSTRTPSRVSTEQSDWTKRREARSAEKTESEERRMNLQIKEQLKTLILHVSSIANTHKMHSNNFLNFVQAEKVGLRYKPASLPRDAPLHQLGLCKEIEVNLRDVPAWNVSFNHTVEDRIGNEYNKQVGN